MYIGVINIYEIKYVFLIEYSRSCNFDANFGTQATSLLILYIFYICYF